MIMDELPKEGVWGGKQGTPDEAWESTKAEVARRVGITACHRPPA